MIAAVLDLVIFICVYGLGWLCAGLGHNYSAGGILIALGLFLFAVNYMRTKFIADMRGLIALSWVCGEGIACLKLSHLASQWKAMTWICFALAYIAFRIGYELVEHKGKPAPKQEPVKDENTAGRVLTAMIVITMLSLLCFIVEAVVLGFIPILSDKPHAYSYFHISGVHYFTVSFTLVPSLFLIYLREFGYGHKPHRGKIPGRALICLIISLILPVLCVSRFQLIFAVGLAMMTYFALYPDTRKRYIAITVLCLIPIYVLLTVFRHHDVAYLNGIFEMKNEHMPIFITQPYMYIANNYENFNCLVEQLPAHSCGIRMTFPVWALTGLKMIYPALTRFGLYINKTELTTLTWIYDFYYDFGIWGVAVFTGLLGAAAAWLRRLISDSPNPAVILFYSQVAVYMSLTFFTTWWSNPTTWFWLGLTMLICIFTRRRNKNAPIGTENQGKTE